MKINEKSYGVAWGLLGSLLGSLGGLLAAPWGILGSLGVSWVVPGQSVGRVCGVSGGACAAGDREDVPKGTSSLGWSMLPHIVLALWGSGGT